MLDFLANRYGVHPKVVESMPLWEAVWLWHAAQRNIVRQRLAWIDDKLATGDLSKEVVHYDENGKPIKGGGGYTDPVGLKRHLAQLYAVLGVDVEVAPLQHEGKLTQERSDVASKMERMLLAIVGGGK